MARHHRILDDALLLSGLSWREIEDLYLLDAWSSPAVDPLLDPSSVEPYRFRELFRFEQGEVSELLDRLMMPGEVSSSSGVKVTDAEALCMTLRRLAYPARLRELEVLFNRDGSVISSVVDKVLSHVEYNFNHLLADINTHRWLTPSNLELFAEAVHAKGAPLKNCWGFLDCRAQRMYRPLAGRFQPYMHKYQALMAANGIICHLERPYPERTNNSGTFQLSSLHDSLEKLAQGRDFTVYGRGQYPSHSMLTMPFEGAALKPHEAFFNDMMDVVWRPVEYSVGRVADSLSVVRFYQGQAFSRQRVARMYKVATLLANCRTCLYGNQVSHFFNVEPPTLEEYLVPLPSDV